MVCLWFWLNYVRCCTLDSAINAPDVNVESASTRRKSSLDICDLNVLQDMKSNEVKDVDCPSPLTSTSFTNLPSEAEPEFIELSLGVKAPVTTSNLFIDYSATPISFIPPQDPPKKTTYPTCRDMTKESGDTSKKEVSTTTTPQFQCPILKPSNYSLWAIRMQIILEANGLWEMIEPNEKTQADNKKDKTAIAFLYQALPEEQLLQITKHKTAKTIWDALKTRHIGEERVQQARLQTLKSEFEMLHMKEDETIDTFTAKLTTILNKAASLGHTMEDETLVRKLLNDVPDRYLQIVASIEKYSDLDEMTLEEAIGRLKTYEERIKGRGRGKHKFSQGRNHENFKEERKDRENSHKNYNRDNFKKSSYDTSKLQCYKCKKIGHIAPKCPQRTKPNEQSSLVEEDLEPTLLMPILEDEEQKVSLHEEDVGYLLSLGQFTEIGCKVVMEDDELRLYDMDNKIFMKVTRQRNRLYKANLRIDQAFDTFKEYKKSIENELRTTLKMLRTDRGGEFTSNEFTQYCKENGIARQLTAPYSPQQNGVAEAVRHAIYILNSVPTKALEDITPYEAIKHRKPNLENLRVFGCIAYAKVPSQHLTKLDDRSTKMVYLGNKQGSKAYRLFDPTTQRVCVSRDVKFKEDETWDWKDYMSKHINDEPEWTNFKIGNLEVTNEHHDQETQPIEDDNEFPNNDDDYASPSRDSPLHSQTPHTPSTQSSEINSQVTPNFSTQSYYQSDNDSIQITNSPSHFDHTPLRGFRTLNDLYENTEELLLAEDEPKNYKEASSDQKWIEAMKTKKDANGNIIKHKARLVAKGYIQQHGIDFEEVFAPVARMETIRLLLAIAANNKWEVHHLDVKSAFLHGDLKEEVYVTQPEGFVKRQDNGKVYRLIKALYGLRQAPRAWNIKLDNTLKSLDFKKCALEQAIYTKTSKDSTLLIGVYVDDLIITGTPKKEIDKFKAQMEEKFEMSDLGLLAYYLGIEVTQTEGDISIRQSAYAIKILKEAGMIDCNETLIPMDPGTRLTKITEGTMVNSTEYRSLIGCLRYLLHTRPDLSYSVGLLSRFMQEPREQHMKAIRQVLRYVKGTKDYGITYKHNGGNKIYGYSDSSYGVNTQEGKGTTDIIFYYEFITATTATTQALWLKRLLSKLTHSQEEKVTIQVDNKLAITLMKNPVFHRRSKHIDTKYHFIRECVKREDIQVEFISGEYQNADILTKALPKIKFLTMRQLIGLKDLMSQRLWSLQEEILKPFEIALEDSYPQDIYLGLKQKHRIYTYKGKHGVYECQDALWIWPGLSNCPGITVSELDRGPIYVGEKIKKKFLKSDMIKGRPFINKLGFVTIKLSGKWIAKSIHKMLKAGIDTWAPKLPV
ncbi:ribonuclease H-like domain, reverse transcriptase, RNA-dependent DNA polymerase [Tanacetum coccineum]